MAVSEDFAPEVTAIGAVRSFVTDALLGVPSVDDVVLVASELVTNVVKHARTPFTVEVQKLDERVRLEVSDGSSVIPAFEDLDESLLGWRMIQRVAHEWGVRSTDGGKLIWVEFDTEPVDPGRQTTA